MTDWPPSVDLFRSELTGRTVAGEPDLSVAPDAQLQLRLDAAVSFVQDRRGDDFDFTGDPTSTLPAPDATTVLGTLMLAARLQFRRRSPDALVDAGELGQARIPSFDPDIDRLLRLGRHQKPRVG